MYGGEREKGDHGASSLSAAPCHTPVSHCLHHFLTCPNLMTLKIPQLSNHTLAKGQRGKRKPSPLKIVDMVAVDCVSACIVLASSQLLTMSFPSMLYKSESPSAAAENSESGEPLCEGVGANSTESHDGDIKTPKSAASRLQPITQVAYPFRLPVAVTKREKGILELLTILEMQAFSMSKLDLFRDESVSQKMKAFALGSRQDPEPREESQNTPLSPVSRSELQRGQASFLGGTHP